MVESEKEMEGGVFHQSHHFHVTGTHERMWEGTGAVKESENGPPPSLSFLVCTTYRSVRNRCRRVRLRCGPSAFAAAKSLCRRHGTEVGNGPDWPDSRTSDARSDKSAARNSGEKKKTE